MIKREELEEAIAECQGERNPNANTCIKLASYYALKRELYGDEVKASRGYSYDAPKEQPKTIIEYEGDTEFGNIIKDKNINEVLPVIEELLETVKVLLPKVYAGFLRKLQ